MRGTVHLVSLGCPKNLVDSEVILGHLREAGYLPVAGPEEAEVILVNTCAFIQAAKEESIETILSLAGWKGHGPCRALVVAGCLPQRYGDELLELLPEADLFLGTGEVQRVVSRLQAFEEKGLRACHRGARSYLPGPKEPRLRATSLPTAYVKIADGCSNGCSYCAVPLIRGPLRSRTVESVASEVRSLAEEGVKEVILVAQDTTAFGLDRSSKSELPKLLRTLDEVDGLEWVRLMYAHPAHVTRGLVETMGEMKRICPYLDLPIQHISPKILRRMNRRPDPEGIRERIRWLREAIPGIHLRTTFIVGFPGETEEDFQRLLDFATETRFEWMGAFAYSREEGTAAAALGPGPGRKVVERRLHELMSLQRRITEEALGQWEGRVVRVLVERAGDGAQGDAMGRGPFQAPEIDGAVRIRGCAVEPGRFQAVRITGVEGYDLLGVAEPAGPPMTQHEAVLPVARGCQR